MTANRLPADAKALRFIKDYPAEKDAFGAHGRIAEAVAAVIQTHNDLKVIGLVGPWGSGKSTVISLIKNTLDQDKTIDTKFFIYDAWLHQSDPPRRSFLENLIEFLGLAKESRWQDRLDELNGQVDDTDTRTTPTLTSAGKGILLSLFLVPLGFHLMDHDWLDTWVHIPVLGWGISVFWTGFIFIMAPAIVAMLIYLAWRPTLNIFSKRFWLKHRPPYDRESILTLFTEKAVTRVNHRVTRSPDPTTIEFQRVFRDILEAVSKPTVRYVFVVDNLDRLPEAAAVELWATIRSFFLGAGARNAARVKLPTILLPIDPDAVERMYCATDKEDAPRLAQAFMDKTFDLTFRVPPPVFSDWKRYLDDQLRWVFDAQYTEEWGYAVVALYEKYLVATPGTAPTARLINTLINSVAVLWLQWKDKVPLETLAYYSINKRDIDDDLAGAIRGDHPEIARFDQNWAAGVAAVHFGVPVADAIQVYLEGDLTAAIAAGDVVSFLNHAKTPGFDRVFEVVIERAGTALEFVSRAAYLLGELKHSPAVWVSSSWRTLAARLAAANPWGEFPSESITGIKYVFQNASEDTLAFRAAALMKAVATVPPAALSDVKTLTWWSDLATMLFDEVAARKIATSKLKYPGDNESYISLLPLLSKRNDVLKWIEPSSSDKAIVDTLAGQFSSAPPGNELPLKFNLLFEINPARDWISLMDAAANQIRSGAGGTPVVTVSVDVLGKLTAKNTIGVNDRLAPLVNEGFLFEKFSQAMSANSIEGAAAALALIVVKDPAFQAAAGQARAHPGIAMANALQGDIAAMDKISNEFDRQIRSFTANNSQKILVNAAEGNAALQPLVRKVLSARVSSKTQGVVNLNDIFEKLPVYLKYVDAPVQTDFATNLAKITNYAEILKKASFNDNLRRWLKLLLDSSDSNVKEAARDELGARMRALPASDWKAAVDSGTEPLTTAREFRVVAPNFDFGSHLYDALTQSHDSVMVAEEAKINRWFELVSFLSSNDQATQMRGLRDLLLRDEVDLQGLRVLSAGSDTLLDAGHFEEEPDRALRYLVLPLLTLPDGEEWITRNAGRISRWLSTAPDTTRGTVRDRVAASWSDGDAPTKERMHKWGGGWAFDDMPWDKPAVSPESDETPTNKV